MDIWRKPTPKQRAYAEKVWGGKGQSKMEMALESGYSHNTANNVKEHVESGNGFKVAMAELARKSNNVAMAIMYEFERRGVDTFSDKDLIGAMNAISSAWSRFNAPLINNQGTEKGNRLRTIILQQVESQTISSSAPAIVDAPPPPIDLDF